jgi:hypothetical protein
MATHQLNLLLLIQEVFIHFVDVMYISYKTETAVTGNVS